MDLKNANVLITGGASGIGFFLTQQLSTIAANVIVIDKNEETLNEVRSIPNVSAYCCDLTVVESVEQTVSQIFSTGIKVNVLINNAGFIHSEPLLNILNRPNIKHSYSNWKKTLDINLNAVFYTTVNVVEAMYNNRIKNGVIINISSIAANGNIGQSAYSASKAAVEALSKTWSKELGVFKIRCVSLAPGFIDTPSTRTALSENTLSKWEQSVPLKRLGQLDEIFTAVKFIIENDYFNGKTLSIDGGLNLP